MDKKQLTEADIRTKFITPALIGSSVAKWNVMTQLREEVFFTKGRVIVRGKTVHRGEAKKADYILVLQAWRTDRRDRSEGQQPFGRGRHAAGAGLRRNPGRAIRLQLQWRRVPGAHWPARATV
jgi:hypothetical protein